MKSPFRFGRVVVGDAFTNRNPEIKRLKSNIKNNVHTMLISPRRWGKSSLVKKVANDLAAKNQTFKFCFIDLFKIRDEGEFYATYANAVIQSTSSKAEEWLAFARSFLSRITPRVSVGTDPVSDFEIHFNLKEVKQNYEDILNLPEKIAQRKGINVIVCIDEFQNLGNFEDPVLFQKRLRSVWQYHQGITYILYGSKRHMMMQLFENKSMPFYKFGDVMYLDKIPRQHLISYIRGAFSGTQKVIDNDLAGSIVDHVKCHPYYTQQLAHLAWTNTDQTVTDKTIEQAVDELLQQNAILYQKEIDGLSNIQINFLKAVAHGVQRLSTQKAIEEHGLSSSANVARIKKALEKREIIDTLHGRVEFIDPVFELWFKDYYL
jgi:hypothetical protein